MFITILMLSFALCLFFVPESQAYVVRTWTFVATLLPMLICILGIVVCLIM